MAGRNDKVQEFIAKLQSEIDEMERKRQDEAMLALGLYEEKEEILDDEKKKYINYDASMKDYKERIVDGEKRYVKSQKIPIRVSREEFAQIQELLAQKALLEGESKQETAKPENPEPPFQVEMRAASSNSGSASFFKVIAWILWIGGLILAFMTSFVDVGYGDSEFRFALFLPTILTYGLYGCMAMVAAELLENVASIRAALESIRFKKN